MKHKALITAGLASLISLAAGAADYDAQLARSYAQLFQPVAGAKVVKGLHLMKPDQLVQHVRSGAPLLSLDIRTPGESGIFSMTLADSMSIPDNEVFLPENLKRIPKDRKVVIVCKSGTRATAIGTALRHVGFSNVYILKGGIMGLAKYLSPKTANLPPKVAAR